jgi:hypothetical protein
VLPNAIASGCIRYHKIMPNRVNGLSYPRITCRKMLTNYNGITGRYVVVFERPHIGMLCFWGCTSHQHILISSIGRRVIAYLRLHHSQLSDPRWPDSSQRRFPYSVSSMLHLVFSHRFTWRSSLMNHNRDDGGRCR